MASQKLITLDLLKQFNHGLCDNMGLTKYDYTYIYQPYAGTGSDKPNKIKLALDDLYDKIEEQAKKLAFVIQVVSTGTNGVQVQFRDKQAQSQELDSFFVASTTDNISIRSSQENIGSGYNKRMGISLNTVSSSSDAASGDPLTTVGYVNDVLQTLKAGSTFEVGSGSISGGEAVTFSNGGNGNIYSINIKNADGTVKYNLNLDATEFLKDSFVSSVELIDSQTTNPKLKFTFNTDDKTPIVVPLNELFANYTSGDGIDVSGTSISVKLSGDQSDYITLSFNDVGSLQARVDTGTLAYNSDGEPGAKFTSSDGLTTAAQAAMGFNNLMGDIYAMAANIKHTTVDVSQDTAITVASTVDPTDGQTTYTVTYETATSAEVNSIFAD